MSTPFKKPRTQQPSTAQQCALVRDLLFFRHPLLQLLALRDIVSLLATCQSLRFDSELTALALLQCTHESEFFRHCLRDSPSVVPSFNWSCSSQDSSVYNDPSRLSPRQRAALLSVAGLVTSSALPSIITTHSGCEGYVYPWFIVPFILPLRINGDATADGLRAALETTKRGLGATFFTNTPIDSAPFLHMANMEILPTEEKNTTVVCRFCEVVQRELATFRADCEAHSQTRQEELETLQNQWRQEGYESDSDVFNARETQFDARMKEKDALFNSEILDEGDSEAIDYLASQGIFDHCGLDLVEAARRQSNTSIGEGAANGFVGELCPEVFRRLHGFFVKNGFRHVRRVAMPFTTCPNPLLFSCRRKGFPCNCSPCDDINSIGMVGGLTPHGFLVGVYLVETAI